MDRKRSGILITVGYVVAFILGGLGYILIGPAIESDSIFLELLVKLAFLDIIMTIIIYLFALFTNNTSFYDPYWSVIPFVLVLFPMIMEDGMWNPLSIITLIVVTIYSHRLTFNWWVRFKGLAFEDYRYNEWRKRLKPWLYEFINFFGFMLMPTVLTFMGTVPLIFAMTEYNGWNYLYLIGILVSIMGIIFEISADLSVINFKKNPENKGKTLDRGLWKYSRHPNYLGELSVWTGFMIIGLTLVFITGNNGYWWLMIIGSIATDILFISYSVPRQDKRMLERHSDYKEYKMRTSALLLLPRRRIKDEKEV